MLERWRRNDIKSPVLILTARDRWSEKVAGINAGADDYVAKPFQMEEVIARVRALLCRSAGFAKAELECGPSISIAHCARDVQWRGHQGDGARIQASSYLMHHQSRVVSRSELVDHLYQQDFDPRSQYD